MLAFFLKVCCFSLFTVSFCYSQSALLIVRKLSFFLLRKCHLPLVTDFSIYRLSFYFLLTSSPFPCSLTVISLCSQMVFIHVHRMSFPLFTDCYFPLSRGCRSPARRQHFSLPADCPLLCSQTVLWWHMAVNVRTNVPSGVWAACATQTRGGASNAMTATRATTAAKKKVWRHHWRHTYILNKADTDWYWMIMILGTYILARIVEATALQDSIL